MYINLKNGELKVSHHPLVEAAFTTQEDLLISYASEKGECLTADIENKKTLLLYLPNEQKEMWADELIVPEMEILELRKHVCPKCYGMFWVDSNDDNYPSTCPHCGKEIDGSKTLDKLYFVSGVQE